MEDAHKFLAFKNAMNTTYKLENHITAAHFARQVLDLEPTGVTNSLSLKSIDIWKQAGCDSYLQEVLPDLPAKRQKQASTRIRLPTQHIHQGD
jgi:hypothetical protein